MNYKVILSVLSVFVLHTGFFFGVFNTLLNTKIEPLKENFDIKIESLQRNQVRIESDIKGIESNIKGIESNIKEIESDIKGIESDIKGIESNIKEMNAKLDQLLSAKTASIK